MRNFLLTVLLLFVASILSYSQNCCALDYHVDWQQTIYSYNNIYSSGSLGGTLQDGSVVVGYGASDYKSTSYGRIVAYTPDGCVKWSVPTVGIPLTRVSPKGDLVYAVVNVMFYESNTYTYRYSSYLYAFDDKGNFKWQKTIYSSRSDGSSIYIGGICTDGTVIIGAGGFETQGDSFGKIIAYTPGGYEKWSFVTDGIPYVLIDNERERIYAGVTRARYVGSSSGYRYSCYLYCVDFEGKYKWMRNIYSYEESYVYATVGGVMPDGTVIVGAGGSNSVGNTYGKLIAYSTDGQLKWTYSTEAVPNARIYPDRAIIYATVNKITRISGTYNYEYSSYLYSFTEDGWRSWRKTVYDPSEESAFAYIGGILRDGTALVGAARAGIHNSSSGKILAYTLEGNTVWSYYTNGQPSLTISKDEKMLYACVNKRLWNSSSNSYQYSVFLLAFSRDVVDSDNDGLIDSIEAVTCTDNNNPDSDGDGIWDGVEDSNRNGIRDPWETSPCNADSDGDAIPDGWEANHGLNPLLNDALLDNDEDGFCNLREFLSSTDPNDANDIPPCEATFDDDQDADGIDLAQFVQEMNRYDCSELDPCQCDLNGDGDVDTIDLILFAEDFGRVQ